MAVCSSQPILMLHDHAHLVPQARRGVAGAPTMHGLTARDSFASSEIMSEVTSDGLGELSSITHDESCITQLEDDILEEPLEESELQEEMGPHLLMEEESMHDDSPAVEIGEWVLTGAAEGHADHGMSSSLLDRCMQVCRMLCLALENLPP